MSLYRFLRKTVLVAAGSAACAAIAGNDFYLSNRAPLIDTPFVALPLGSVKADGWLLKQLELQKKGLTGHAEELYPACKADSGWLGGNGESWEKGPYYVKGLIALAYTLDDAELKQRAEKWVDWALASQRPNGQFGPTGGVQEGGAEDWWPRMVVLYYLREYADATGDERVVPFFLNYFRYQLNSLKDNPLHTWGKARAGDNIDVVLWTYNRTGEKYLLDLAELLHKQAYDWSNIYADGTYYGFGDDFHPHHIVNVSQALRMPALVYQFTRNGSDRDGFRKGVETLEAKYGRIDGQVSGVEMLSDRSATTGVELCADAERMLSNEIALRILGDPVLGDQLEEVAYNSLPAHTSKNLKQITYYQFPNQVSATHHGHGFPQDYPNANMPGPHSGYPCCCYNWHMAWPMLVQNMWAATADNGLAAVAYGPSAVTAKVGGGSDVTITEQTAYPFEEQIELKIGLSGAAEFPLKLRIPAWCDAPSISVNGIPVAGVKPETFHTIDRVWADGDKVILRFPMKIVSSSWVNNSIGIKRGPLAYSLMIKEDWRKVNDYQNGFDEFEIYPASSWNYGLVMDRGNPGKSIKVERRAMTDTPYVQSLTPVRLKVKARKIPEWTVRASMGTAVLGRSDGGWHELSKNQLIVPPREKNHVKVVARGRRIQVFVNDMKTPVIDREDDACSHGSIGLRTWQTDARFDNIRVNGTLKEDFSRSVGSRWDVFGGEWSVEDGQYRVKPGDGSKAILKDLDLGDFTLEADVTLEEGQNAGLIFRATDAGVGADAYKGYYVGLNAVSNDAQDADEPPQSPVISTEPVEEIVLVPFGANNIRVSYFPEIETK
ncbi:MAG: glycoside hydrolase family 127 protein [Pontiellaceae bacterium]|nr:glycoside hydrolase family 127 protein [Pontiellaceae bacterium]MBN2786182.1 glycoside hydrolase family 127 protein [Pontiellaceae bacterium]